VGQADGLALGFGAGLAGRTRISFAVAVLPLTTAVTDTEAPLASVPRVWVEESIT
jgi:hypothetical protein